MLNVPSMRDQVSDEEWQLRCDLAACYRLVAACPTSACVRQIGVLD